jgi:hypothetical protein
VADNPICSIAPNGYSNITSVGECKKLAADTLILVYFDDIVAAALCIVSEPGKRIGKPRNRSKIGCIQLPFCV